MKRILWFSLLLAFSLAGCSFLQGKSEEKIISHPAPELKVNTDYFTEKGCYDNPACLPDELKNIPFPVESINKPNDILGGLEPELPIALAISMGFTPEEEVPSVYVHRCMAHQYVRYLVYYNDKIHLVDSAEGLAAIYAPIDSPLEALSFAVAATGLSAQYDLDQYANLDLYAAQIEETYVSETGDGYLVHLFDSYLCGCGPHIVQSVDVTVTREGKISLSEAVDAYSDPKLDGLCID